MEKILKKKNLILISENKPNDNMTTEAYYRMLHILNPLCNSLKFMAVGFVPEKDRVMDGVDIIQSNKLKDIVAILYGLDTTYMFWYGGSKRLGIAIILLKILKPNAKIIIRIDGGSVGYYRQKLCEKIPFINKLKYLRLFILHKIAELFIYNMVNVIAYQYEGLIEDYGLQRYRNKMMIANQYIDLEKFKDIVPFEQRYLDLGYIGRIDGGKGVLEFIEALRYLKDEYNVVYKVVIAGDGDTWYQVMDMIQKYGLKDSVSYIGKMPIGAIPKLMNQIKFLILPSYREGLPKVVIEAMACGCVPITTDVGGLKYLIDKQENGYVIKKIDNEHIACSIYNAISSTEMTNEIRSNFAETLRYYTLEETQKRYERILEVANR